LKGIMREITFNKIQFLAIIGLVLLLSGHPLAVFLGIAMMLYTFFSWQDAKKSKNSQE